MSTQEIRRRGFEEVARKHYSEKYPQRHVETLLKRDRLSGEYAEKCTQCMWTGYNAALDKATIDFMETLSMITDLGYATPETLKKIEDIVEGR